MWMKVDDGLHTHRKTRAVIKSHKAKRRDAAPMGIWVLAGSWAAQNGTDGWVPQDELDRWDEDWEDLVARLVHSGYWWPQERDGEAGYGFNDWHDYNDPADLASRSGTYGNHVRWHVNEKRVDPECDHCPTEPDRGDIAPTSGGDRGAIGGDSGLDDSLQGGAGTGTTFPQVRSGLSGGDSGGDSRNPSPPIALPEPEPEPVPNPDPGTTLSDKSDHADHFDQFWETYSHKVGRKKAETAFKAALKKPGVTADMLIAAAAAYITWQMNEGKHPTFTKHAATWLHGEHWRDERVSKAPQTNIQRHMALVQQLAEQGPPGPQPPAPRQIGGPA